MLAGRDLREVSCSHLQRTLPLIRTPDMRLSRYPNTWKRTGCKAHELIETYP